MLKKRLSAILLCICILSPSIAFATTSSDLSANTKTTTNTANTHTANIDTLISEATPTSNLPELYKPTSQPGPSLWSKEANGSGDETATQTVSSKDIRKYATNQILPKIAIRLVAFISVASLVGLMYAGYLYLSAIGTTENYNTAKSVIIYSILGLVIALLAYAIVQIVFTLPLTPTR